MHTFTKNTLIPQKISLLVKIMGLFQGSSQGPECWLIKNVQNTTLSPPTTMPRVPLQLCFYEKSTNCNFLFCELEIFMLFQGASNQNVVKNQSLLIWVNLQLCFYVKSPYSNFLFSELEIVLLFQDFPGALRAPGCLKSKRCKIPKCTHLVASSTLLLCKKSIFQLFI